MTFQYDYFKYEYFKYEFYQLYYNIYITIKQYILDELGLN